MLKNPNENEYEYVLLFNLIPKECAVFIQIGLLSEDERFKKGKFDSDCQVLTKTECCFKGSMIDLILPESIVAFKEHNTNRNFVMKHARYCMLQLIIPGKRRKSFETVLHLNCQVEYFLVFLQSSQSQLHAVRHTGETESKPFSDGTFLKET